MKAYLLVLLAPDVDVADEPALRAAVATAMAPHGEGFDAPDDDAADSPPGTGRARRWDYYLLCTREVLPTWPDPAFTAALPDGAWTARTGDVREWTHAVLTPDGRWHESRATYRAADPHWPAAAAAIAAPFREHRAVLLLFHA